MLEPRQTHHLATIQIRVTNPRGYTAWDIALRDQDLYYLIAGAGVIRRLRRVLRKLRKTVDSGAPRTVADLIQQLGDAMGGKPGLAAYRGVAIDAGPDTDDGEDVWFESRDQVLRILLLEYARFWVVPTAEPDHMLIELACGVRDRPLLTLEAAIERLGHQPAMMWSTHEGYVGLGWRRPVGEQRLVVDRPLDARNEPEAIREMGLTPVIPDARWYRRTSRYLRRAAGL